MSVDILLAELRAINEARRRELHEALRTERALRLQVFNDCANLIAGIGGYVAPSDPLERKAWIAKQAMNDPVFVAKVHAAASLVREYMDAAREPL